MLFWFSKRSSSKPPNRSFEVRTSLRSWALQMLHQVKYPVFASKAVKGRTAAAERKNHKVAKINMLSSQDQSKNTF